MRDLEGKCDKLGKSLGKPSFMGVQNANRNIKSNQMQVSKPNSDGVYIHCTLRLQVIAGGVLTVPILAWTHSTRPGNTYCVCSSALHPRSRSSQYSVVFRMVGLLTETPVKRSELRTGLKLNCRMRTRGLPVPEIRSSLPRQRYNWVTKGLVSIFHVVCDAH
jgi:hypothetical protein